MKKTCRSLMNILNFPVRLQSDCHSIICTREFVWQYYIDSRTSQRMQIHSFMQRLCEMIGKQPFQCTQPDSICYSILYKLFRSLPFPPLNTLAEHNAGAYSAILFSSMAFTARLHTLANNGRDTKATELAFVKPPSLRRLCQRRLCCKRVAPEPTMAHI